MITGTDYRSVLIKCQNVRPLICFSFCAYAYRQLPLNMFLPHLSCAFFSPNTRQADRTISPFTATLRPVAPEGSRLLIRCSTRLLRGGGSGTGSFSSHRSTLDCKSTFPEKSCKIYFFKFDLMTEIVLFTTGVCKTRGRGRGLFFFSF